MKQLIQTVVLMAILSMSFAACEKNEPDPRDQYVGTWNYTRRGSLIMYSASGQPLNSIPMNTNGTTPIEKIGQSDLNIDGDIYTLTGNRLTASPQSDSQVIDGVLVNLMLTHLGNASAGQITITSECIGTWSYQGQAGTLSGTFVQTYTKQ